MPIGTVLNVFVAGVKPLWEDAACKEGGRFSLRVPKTHTAKYWEDLLLAMIGEQFSCADEILGLVLSTKYNGDLIAVWHRHCDEKIVESIKADIARFVNVSEDSGVKVDNVSFQEIMNAPKHPTHHYVSRGGRGGYNNYRGGRGDFRGKGYRGGY